MLALISIDGRFLFDFPLWLIEHHPKGSGQYLVARHQDGNIATPIFADWNVAFKFLNDSPDPKAFSVLSVPDAPALLRLLTLLESQGVTTINFDSIGHKAISFNIQKVRQSTPEWIRSQSPPEAPEQG